MHPEHGGRLILRRLEVDAEVARYSVEALTKDRAWLGQAQISRADGSVKFVAWSDEAAPDWLCDLGRSALRVAWRSSEQSGFPWRVTRWRPEPDPNAS